MAAPKLLTTHPKDRQQNQHVVHSHKAIACQVRRATRFAAEFRKNQKHIPHFHGSVAVEVFRAKRCSVAIESGIGVEALSWIGGGGVVVARGFVLATGAFTGVTDCLLYTSPSPRDPE